MRVITCPEVFYRRDGELSIFLAGGITGAPDWQKEVIERFDTQKFFINHPHLAQLYRRVALINPRRSDFDCSKASSSIEQIEWEKRALDMVDMTFFWFPKEAMCHITMFELGVAIGQMRTIRVGVEPGYCRELDIKEQAGRHHSKKIYTTLDALYSLRSNNEQV